MLDHIRRFVKDESGQDLIEYTLLITFIVIACMWFVAGGRGAVAGIWTKGNTQLTNAAIAANGN